MLDAIKQNAPAPVTPDEIRRVVLKLRWIGHEAEAKELQLRLSAVARGESVTIAATDTD